ncbi:heterokaryon incompatibility protein-domain-containing protein [Pyrenochaeta sp. MPI-SDFR-AT-0127]|nr:heterokaryon incompatibility protein-domain-containing protein [Pyrenochaeta sp. MPI-SDFR-AT-0127]
MSWRAQELPGNRACHFCKDLFTNPISQSAILRSTPPFEYSRSHESLQDTSDDGCILCMILLDRHEQFGPVSPEIIFTIQKFNEQQNPNSTLCSLLIKGPRRGSGMWHVSLHVYAHEDDPAAKIVPFRPPETNLSSDKCIRLAKKWLEECTEDHGQCPKYLEPLLPTRVLKVTGTDDGNVKLHTSAPEEHGTYLALSYCWGGPQPCRTLLSNVAAYSTAISVEELPQTIQDAILVTRQLGFSYLWIDSLCILQDDESDKEREILHMREIYENALLTMSAASAESCTEGFLHQRQEGSHPISAMCRRSLDYYRSFELPYKCSDGAMGVVRLTEGLEGIKTDEPISSRAWTLQETMLSTRVLQYGGSHMVWRCSSAFNTSGGTLNWSYSRPNIPVLDMSGDLPINHLNEPELEPPPVTFFGIGKDTYQVASVPPLDHPPPPRRFASVSKIEKAWLEVVEMYSQRSMSDQLDKFPAMAGIAERFQQAFNDQYNAGLWGNDMLIGLAWSRKLYSKSVRPYIPSYGDGHETWRAPSWSWASLDGPVSYSLILYVGAMLHRRATVYDVQVQPRLDNTLLDRLFLAHLWIEGWMRPVDIEPATRWREMEHADVYILENHKPRSKYSLWRLNGPEPEVDDDEHPEPAIRCGTAILDESIKSMPYKWTHAHDLDEIYAFPLFSSQSLAAGGHRLRTHGLLLIKWPIGNYERIGWFNSFASSPADFNKWFEDENQGKYELL